MTLPRYCHGTSLPTDMPWAPSLEGPGSGSSLTETHVMASNCGVEGVTGDPSQTDPDRENCPHRALFRHRDCHHNRENPYNAPANVRMRRHGSAERVRDRSLLTA